MAMAVHGHHSLQHPRLTPRQHAAIEVDPGDLPPDMNEAPSREPPASAVRAAAAEVLSVWRHERPDPGPFPGTAQRIMDLLHRPQPDFNRLVVALSQDAAIASKLLAVANSAKYAGGGEIQGVRAAVMRIGMQEVGKIAVGLAGRALFDASSKKEYALFPHIWGTLFHEAMTAGFAASLLALTTRGADADRAFLAGMLHDIGKPIALRSLVRLQGKGVMGWALVSGAIPQILEAVHLEVGVAAMQAWKLPAYLQAVAAQHHDPIVGREPQLMETHFVRVVDGIQATRAGTLQPAQQQALQQSCEVLGIEPPRLRSLTTEIAELAARVTEIFGVADPAGPSPAPAGPQKRVQR